MHQLRHAQLTAGFVPIELDRKRNLLIDLNALATLEETTGRSLLVPAQMQKPGLRFICQMVHAFCMAEDPSVQFNDIAGAISFTDIPYLTEKIQQAWTINVAGTPAAGEGLPLGFAAAEEVASPSPEANAASMPSQKLPAMASATS